VPGRRRGFCLSFATALLVWGISEARADVPINGRHQELDFTAAQVQAIAAAAYAQRIDALRRKGELDRDARLFERVRRITGRLVAQAVRLKPESVHWRWEVHVADSSDFDAFSMAGGKILVGERFVKAQRLTDGELAALLAHEIAHALAEHVREQLSAVRRLSPAYAKLSPEDIAYLLGWDLSVSLRLAELSRLHELEADDIGIYLAAQAGFDPRALVRFYQKLNRITHGPFLIDTHGTAQARMRAVENFAAYAEPVYRESASANHTPSFALH
jgi:predicted Zn-dependent protease